MRVGPKSLSFRGGPAYAGSDGGASCVPGDRGARKDAREGQEMSLIKREHHTWTNASERGRTPYLA